jgi:hypothetical protein
MDQNPAPVSEKQPLVVFTTTRLILRAAVEADVSVLQNLIFGDGEAARLWVRATQIRPIARAGRSAKCTVHSRAREARNALRGEDCGV